MTPGGGRSSHGHDQGRNGLTNRLIYLVEPDTEIRENLKAQIGHYGFGVAGFETLAQARLAAETGKPGILVVAMSEIEGDTAMEIARIENTIQPAPPIVFLSEKEDLAMRLRCVRFGGRAFFKKPVNMDALIGRLEDLTTPAEGIEHRILIVESNAEIADSLETILGEAGMKLYVISDPLQSLDAIDRFRPDLILMDLYYPDVLGMELAAVIRQQGQYQSIPIVFHSSETRSSMQMAALRRGGDDYLTRPIAPENLILSVRSRVEKSHTQNSFLYTDGLTGLVNHSAMHASLQRKIEQARENGGNVTFALVDIDKFKKINDTYGHPIGDIVIKSLARLLKQRVWSSDILGRFSGEEFGVVITSMDGITAARVFNEIRVDFAQVAHSWAGGEFTATFSVGLAGFPRYNDADAMESATEKAVRRIKDTGGNRVALIR